MERLLKIEEVSNLLQVSRKTVYNWVCYGYIPHIKVSNIRGHRGALRFKESDLNEWIDKRKEYGRHSIKC